MLNLPRVILSSGDFPHSADMILGGACLFHRIKATIATFSKWLATPTNRNALAVVNDH
jgi:hypothetical protein